MLMCTHDVKCATFDLHKYYEPSNNLADGGKDKEILYIVP
jgi:hypothetical protein